jgi:hypothetical protein
MTIITSEYNRVKLINLATLEKKLNIERSQSYFTNFIRYVTVGIFVTIRYIFKVIHFDINNHLFIIFGDPKLYFATLRLKTTVIEH